MAFVTAAGMEGGGGLVRVVYQVMDNPPRLVMSESAFFSPDRLGRDPVDKPGERSAVLLEGFRALKFEYMLSDGVETEWRSEWNGHDEEALPAAVRVMIAGIPGLEVETWGQEIPVMTCHYGDSGCELSDEDESRVEEADTDEDEGDDEGGPRSSRGDND